MPAPATAVDSLHEEFAALLAFLEEAREVSMRNLADDNFRKALLLAAASYFEQRLTESVLNVVERATSNNHVVRWLVKKKAVERQYHTWFNWNARNANQFFGLFGESFSRHIKEMVKREDLSASIQAFLEIGNDRNRLVHQNFASFTLEKTSKEIYDMYRLAAEFVEWFPQELRQFSDMTLPDTQESDQGVDRDAPDRGR